ncbi:hypothetical protein GCM10023194_31150 [Planotetraspora phitsanulokensis]|uniref:Uncharacterized protein n=1 Tax=Planotetraspora phitsanulokensis TaxID=575192 RepID=A0A8J3U0N8_9ACTN|nr:hypothetical protein Pph01_07500 [Planotetraspora phitsanulokensis]
MAEVLREIAGRSGCHVVPGGGSAVVSGNVVLPEDLRQLYELCGGALLFEDAPFPRRVCGPGDFVPASPRLLTPEVAQQVAEEDPADLTNNCYVIVDGGEGLSTEPHVVMDLSPERAGRCYAAAWDTYGVVGEMPVLATTVVELLQVLLADGGNEALPAAVSDGDAYEF